VGLTFVRFLILPHSDPTHDYCLPLEVSKGINIEITHEQECDCEPEYRGGLTLSKFNTVQIACNCLNLFKVFGKYAVVFCKLL